jgi:outer membrane protein OmpA-like peptidoglycan-associated protein
MNTTKILFLLLFGAFLSIRSTAQLKQAEKAYERMAYKDAANYFENALKKDTANFSAWSKLGTCYRNLSDSKNAERAYGKVVRANAGNADDHYFYILAMMSNQRYVDVKKEIDAYENRHSGDKRIELLKTSSKNLDEYLQKKNSYSFKSINTNGMASDICPVPFGEGIVFISDRGSVGMKKTTNTATNRSFYAPYYAKGTAGSFDAATRLDTYESSNYHSGPVCFSADGNLMMITRSNHVKGKGATDDKGMIRLQIYSSAKGEKGWGLEVAMPFNSTNYSCMHPSLSADGKTLYFASDMPGGEGGIDIWQSTWDGSAWGTPVNVGDKINSIGDDVFPFITSENVLYYSSNGLPGLGGLDVYMSEKSGTEWSRGENLGGDINSSQDDFGLSYIPASKTGYFSSNRNDQGINDDIYFFEKLCTNSNISVVDEETGKPIAGASVKIIENGVDIGTVLTDDTGIINRCLNPSRNYEFISDRAKYTTGKATLSSSQLAASSGSASSNIRMKRIPDSVAHVEGRVFNADDKLGVAGLTVSLVNKKSGETKTATTDASGKYRFEKLDIDCDYEVRTKKTDCGEPIESFNTKGIVGTKTITMDIPLLCKNDVIEIENIYYDYKKFDIRPDAALELDKIVIILNKYPNMRIELRSHTDSRGNDNFNLKLSDDRANSAALYIIGKGIDSKRIVAKGYGEKELINKCKNGVKCEEKEHEENRRTEFKILSL